MQIKTKKQPPKKWINRTIQALKKDKSIKDAKKLCAWLWNKGISEQSRKQILKNPDLKIENIKKPVAPAKKALVTQERGLNMARRKGRAKSRKMSGEVAYYGGRKKSRRRRRMSGEVAYYGGRRSSRKMSGSSKAGKLDIVKPLTNTAIAIGGGIAGRFAKNAIPIEDQRIKAAIPLVIGIILSMIGRKNEMLKTMGFGMATIGGAELLGSLFPNVALLQGEAPAQVAYTSQDIQEALNQGLISQDEAATLMQAAGFMGAIEDFSGQDEGPAEGQSMPDEIAESTWETVENQL